MVSSKSPIIAPFGGQVEISYSACLGLLKSYFGIVHKRKEPILVSHIVTQLHHLACGVFCGASRLLGTHACRPGTMLLGFPNTRTCPGTRSPMFIHRNQYADCTPHLLILKVLLAPGSSLSSILRCTADMYATGEDSCERARVHYLLRLTFAIFRLSHGPALSDRMSLSESLLRGMFHLLAVKQETCGLEHSRDMFVTPTLTLHGR